MPNTDPKASYNPEANYAMTVRTPKRDQDAAKDALTERGWGLREFFVACLLAVAADPDAVLAQVEAHRREPGKPGRPRKDQAEPDEAPGVS